MMAVSKPETSFPNGLDLGNDVCIIAGSAPPVNGTAGSGAGFCGKGSMYIDTSTGLMYINSGTLLSPLWSGGNGGGSQPSYGTLRQAGAVVDGETVTIGTLVYQAEVVNTDSTKTVSLGEMATGTPATTERFTMTAHGLIRGDLIRVQNEIMQVLDVWSANSIKLLRGVSGTTIATHANAQAIYTAVTPGANPTRIRVGLVTTLTNVAWLTALAADINNPLRTNSTSVAGPNVLATRDGNAVLFLVTAAAPGGTPSPSAAVSATTETLTNGAFDAVALVAGSAQVARTTIARVPTAAEVTEGKMRFAFPFVPVVDSVEVRITATIGVAKAWDGAATVATNLVIVDNAGSTDWAATDTVIVTAHGAS